MTKTELQKTLALHLKWALGETGGVRANLTGANLHGADLTRADLYGADLTGANLHGADLTRADLTRADLYKANLHGADLTGANLHGADLTGADLYKANLHGADLTNLQKARLSILPDCGDVIGWKKCQGDVIVKLLIPESAKRSNSTGRKCRAEYADVLEVIGAKVGYSLIPSGGEKLEYRKGERVRCVGKFNENRWEECATGIHFYITRVEAENN